MSGIKVKDCNLGCGTQIYWDTDEGFYKEYDNDERHFCPNFKKTGGTKPPFKPKTAQPSVKEKLPKDDNLLILQGSVGQIQEGYAHLCDVLKKYEGKVHGSQSHVYSTGDGSELCLFVYYEVPEGTRQHVLLDLGNSTD